MVAVKIKLLVVSLAFLLAACGVPEPTPTVPSEVVMVALSTHTPEPEPTLTATSTATTTPTAVPTQTATLSPTPTPTATPDPTCPEAGSAAPFTYPADTTELQASILAYLNAGGQWQDLMTLLDELEIEHDWVQADMNGDGVEETAVYANFRAEKYTFEQGWWIFHCQSENFEALYAVESIYGFHDYFETVDIDSDGNLEIIDVGGSATSACTMIPNIWSWQSDKIIDYSPGYAYSLGCYPNFQLLISDIDNDNLKEMTMIGGTIGHMDNAPPRIITQTFKLEGNSYTLIEKIYAPAEYRFQLLDDAQSALDAGNISEAMTFYNQAAHEDITTINSYFFLPPDIAKERGEERDYPDAYQKAFALFRLGVIQLTLEYNGDANNTFTELIAAYPEDEPGHEFVLLTQIFFDDFNNKKTLDEACAQVTEFVSKNYTDRPRLTSHFYWGSNVAFYHTPDSLCPIFTIPSENEP